MAVRLLLDENLSERLLSRIEDLFPGSAHVRRLGEEGAHDRTVWEIARRGDFVLVTRDEDFITLSISRGAPPKVVWLNVGNARTAEVASLLRARIKDIETFSAQTEYTFLIIGNDSRGGGIIE